MRDAIIVSGWTWQANNVPERLALALAHTGRRILYCERPVSVFRHSRRDIKEVEKGIFVFGPTFVSTRLEPFALFSRYQAKLVATQILARASKLELRNPFFIYPHGDIALAICKEFKRRGSCLIHVCMDYEPPLSLEHAQKADLTLAIPELAFRELTTVFHNKVKLFPQLASQDTFLSSLREPHEISSRPRPRIGYLGNMSARVSIQLVNEILTKHPEWQFFSFGAAAKWLSLPNEHVLPWCSQNEMAAVLAALDVGVMPYDCTDQKNLHCVPLKLFDYFSRGIPVVSTPIVYVREFADLVYVGATASEFADAVSQALAEPADSPKRVARMEIARKHSIGSLSQPLSRMLEETQRFPDCCHA
jgi:glycosyltransferase involved in cell wall biosynthesis